MGKKKGGKKGNDNDFFAGLSAPTEAAPAMTEEEAEALAEKEAERARTRAARMPRRAPSVRSAIARPRRQTRGEEVERRRGGA